ncbi:MAG: hypothetical protein HYY50_03765 [Candidatus Kerfeldbacteria bacterium]|nr:hypothetical protein [Candidatus Kerfeldbacteria bacterium]
MGFPGLSRRDIWIGATLIVIPVLFALPTITKNLPLSPGDYINQYYIWQSYFVKSIQSFNIPFWNPWVFGGAPFFANPQTAALSPFSWMLLPFHPNPVLPGFILDLQFCFIVGVGTLGVYLWLRRWFSELPSTLGAGLWFFSPVGLWLLRDSTTAMATIAWWPFLLYFTDRLIDRRSRRGVAALAGTIALSWFAGHPPTFVASLLGLGLYGIARIGKSWRTWRAMVVATCSGLGLAAVQLFPALDFVAQTTQVAVTAGNALPTITPFGLSASVVTADAYRFVPVTIGVVPLLFVIIAWRHRVHSVLGAWMKFCVLGTIALAAIIAAREWLATVPFIHNLVRYPWRYVFLPLTAVLPMAVAGFAGWNNTVRSRRRTTQKLIVTLGLFGLAVSVTNTNWISTASIAGSTIILLLTTFRFDMERSSSRLLIAVVALASVALTWSRALPDSSGRTWTEISRQFAVLRQAPDTGDRIVTGGDKLRGNGSMLYSRPNVGGYDSLLLRSYRRLERNGGSAGLNGRWRLNGVRWEEQLARRRAWVEGQRSDVQVYRASTGRLTVRVETTWPGRLVLNQPYEKNWSASAGSDLDLPTEPNRQGYLTVQVPAGRTQINLRYLPGGLFTGFLVTTLTVAWLLWWNRPTVVKRPDS